MYFQKQRNAFSIQLADINLYEQIYSKCRNNDYNLYRHKNSCNKEIGHPLSFNWNAKC